MPSSLLGALRGLTHRVLVTSPQGSSVIFRFYRCSTRADRLASLRGLRLSWKQGVRSGGQFHPWACPVTERRLPSHRGSFWFAPTLWATNHTSGNLSWVGNPERRSVLCGRAVPAVAAGGWMWPECHLERKVSSSDKWWLTGVSHEDLWHYVKLKKTRCRIMYSSWLQLH